jgi:hypothetical protein
MVVRMSDEQTIDVDGESTVEEGGRVVSTDDGAANQHIATLVKQDFVTEALQSNRPDSGLQTGEILDFWTTCPDADIVHPAEWEAPSTPPNESPSVPSRTDAIIHKLFGSDAVDASARFFSRLVTADDTGSAKQAETVSRSRTANKRLSETMRPVLVIHVRCPDETEGYMLFDMRYVTDRTQLSHLLAIVGGDPHDLSAVIGADIPMFCVSSCWSIPYQTHDVSNDECRPADVFWRTNRSPNRLVEPSYQPMAPHPNRFGFSGTHSEHTVRPTRLADRIRTGSLGIVLLGCLLIIGEAFGGPFPLPWVVFGVTLIVAMFRVMFGRWLGQFARTHTLRARRVTEFD